MHLKKLRQLLFLALMIQSFAVTSITAQCISGLKISTRTGATQLDRCPQQINNPDIIRFTTGHPPTPVGYLVTNEENTIIRYSASSNLDMSGLGTGTFRVWAFSYAGSIQVEAGQNANEARLGSICGRLTENYVTVRNFGDGDCFSIQVLHNNNGESKVINAGEGLEHIGGVARFKRKLDGLRSVAFVNGWYSILLSSGDHFVESPEFSANLSLSEDERFYDAIALQRFGYDAIGLGNHDFDFGPDILERFIRDFGNENVPPFVSTNVDFSAEPGLQALVEENRITKSKIIFRGDEPMGVIGLTTPALSDLSNPGNVTVNNALAEIVQLEVEAFEAQGINKIILISHLQSLEEELALAESLSGVDIIIAGGSEDLLTNDPSVALEDMEVKGPYPLKAKDRDDKDVLLVTTPGKYRYVGQLAITFFPYGEIALIDDSSGPVLIDNEEENAELLELVTNPVRAFVEGLGGNLIAAPAMDEPSNPGFQTQVYPNPINEELNINYHLVKDGQVTIRLTNTLGRQVTTAFTGQQAAGHYAMTLHLAHLPQGTYFLTIQDDSGVETLTLVKRG